MELQKKGVKEAKELLNGVGVLVVMLLEQFKDGFQVEDLPVLLGKIAMNAELKEALSGVQNLPGEFKDLDINEGIELGAEVFKIVQKIFVVLKK